MDNQNAQLLRDFSDYCARHPEQRFWQALRNWAEVSAVSISRVGRPEPEDTFYFRGKNS